MLTTTLFAPIMKLLLKSNHCHFKWTEREEARLRETQEATTVIWEPSGTTCQALLKNVANNEIHRLILTTHFDDIQAYWLDIYSARI